MAFYSFVGLLCLLATFVHGHPTQKEPQRRAVDLESFRLRGSGSYVSVPATQKRSLEHGKRATNLETALSFLKSTFPSTTFRLMPDHYVGSNGVEHFYFKQNANNIIDIDNADLNINIAKDGTILSYGHSLYNGTLPSATLTKRDFVGPLAALAQVNALLNLSLALDTASAKLSNADVVLEDAPNDSSAKSPSPVQGKYVIEGTQGAHQAPKARLVYLKTEQGGLDLVWRVETDVEDMWILSYVDARKADTMLGVVDYAAHASYLVYPWGQKNPLEGPRTIEVNPQDLSASPLTWQDNSAPITDTHGNNAIAQSNFNDNMNIADDVRPVATNGEFFYPLNLDTSNSSEYIDASVTQLFYTVNIMHDMLYSLGFNEAAGNFQQLNNGKGGAEGDGVILNAQNGGGVNNAFFQTPTDGSSPRMTMYMWGNATSGQPMRDPSFDADIIIHEYTHGLSNRLTGGPMNSNCLQTIEASGLGEGWSDFFSIATNITPNTTRNDPRPIGAWVQGNPNGVRTVPYTSDYTINPLTYSSVNNVAEIHRIGTVWCTILHELLWNLLRQYGVNRSRKPNYATSATGIMVPTDGRYLAMKLVMDGMALQSCNPTFVDARNGILDADRVLTGGANLCLLWQAFARRGLGVGVQAGEGAGGIGVNGQLVGRVNNFSVPEGC